MARRGIVRGPGLLRQPGSSQRIGDLINQGLANIAESLEVPDRKSWSSPQQPLGCGTRGFEAAKVDVAGNQKRVRQTEPRARLDR